MAATARRPGRRPLLYLNMGNILRCPNGNSLLLTPRSGSHAIVNAAIKSFWPDVFVDPEAHPAAYLPIQEDFDGSQRGLGLLVRNPIERFRSMAAHSKAPLSRLLMAPYYGPLPQGDFRHFKFETQFQECADWLGITAPLEIEDSTEESDKPALTEYQLQIVMGIYAQDMKLWESL